MRVVNVERRSKKYAPRQYVSDYELEPAKEAVIMSNAKPPFERGTGTVKFFNSAKGFGFVTRDNGEPDVFVHANALLRSGWPSADLKEGERIEFDVIPVEGKNPKANSIKRV